MLCDRKQCRHRRVVSRDVLPRTRIKMYMSHVVPVVFAVAVDFWDPNDVANWRIVADSCDVPPDIGDHQFVDSFQSSWLARIVPFDSIRYIYADSIPHRGWKWMCDWKDSQKYHHHQSQRYPRASDASTS